MINCYFFEVFVRCRGNYVLENFIIVSSIFNSPKSIAIPIASDENDFVIEKNNFNESILYGGFTYSERITSFVEQIA